jgi:hypothetical protein
MMGTTTAAIAGNKHKTSLILEMEQIFSYKILLKLTSTPASTRGFLTVLFAQPAGFSWPDSQVHNMLD